MLVATFHKGTQSITYWTRGQQLKREHCESQVIAKLLIMEEKLKHKIIQQLCIER